MYKRSLTAGTTSDVAIRPASALGDGGGVFDTPSTKTSDYENVQTPGFEVFGKKR
jgi:hypothetical protein